MRRWTLIATDLASDCGEELRTLEEEAMRLGMTAEEIIRSG